MLSERKGFLFKKKKKLNSCMNKMLIFTQSFHVVWFEGCLQELVKPEMIKVVLIGARHVTSITTLKAPSQKCITRNYSGVSKIVLQ